MVSMITKIWSTVILFVCIVIQIFSGSTWGAEFPTKEIELWVSYAPGGAQDSVARALSPKLAEVLGKPVVIINKPGGSGIMCTTLLSKTKPDGYTVQVGATSALLVAPNLQKLEYNPLTDFTYIGSMAVQPSMVYVRSESAWRTIEELLAYAKKNPKKIKYGTWGLHSGGHFAMEAIAKEKSIEWGHIPFKGDGPCVTALLGGHIDVGVTAAGHAPFVRAGNFRGLLMLQNKRSQSFSDVPCLKDVGLSYNPVGITEGITGIIAPKGLPNDIRKKYEMALKQAIKDSRYVNVEKTLGLEPFVMFGDEFEKWIETSFKNVKENVNALGFKAE
jgi:tripartite-type tricarboxylate transporter receptor subunit TctC